MWRHEVPICAGDLNEYQMPIGDLWVRESDYAEVCGRLGLKTYYWPRVPWPQELADIEERESCDPDKLEFWFERGYEETTSKRRAAPSISSEELERKWKEQSVQRQLSGTGAYFPLKQAACFAFGVPDGVRMNSANPAWLLWLDAISAKKEGWKVRDIERPEVEGGAAFHIADFIEWSIQNDHEVSALAIEEARRYGDVSDTFEQTVRLYEIERKKDGLRRANFTTGEGLLEREKILAELEDEKLALERELTARRQGPALRVPERPGDASNRNDEAQLAGAEQAQVPIQERRVSRLLKWLDEQGIPAEARLPLRGYSLEDIYRALVQFTEFRSEHSSGDPIEFSSFKKHFWKPQKVCRLPTRNTEK